MTAPLRVGAVVSPGTAQLSARDIAYRVNACGAAAIVTDHANAPKVEQIAGGLPDPGQVVDRRARSAGSARGDDRGGAACFDAGRYAVDDEALCFFTSGTTGYPEDVPCTLTATRSRPRDDRAATGSTTARTTCTGPSPTRAGRRRRGAASSGRGARARRVRPRRRGRFDAARTLEMLARYPITTFCAPPTALPAARPGGPARALPVPRAAPLVGAGEPLNPEVIEAWRDATGLTIREGYGQTETVLLCGNLPEPRGAAGLDGRGRARPSSSRVIDEEGTRAAAPATRAIWPCACARSAGRPVPRVLEEPGGDRGLPSRRLVPHRRPGASRDERRLLLVRRPLRRRDHLRRLPHRAVRGRERAARAPGGRESAVVAEPDAGARRGREGLRGARRRVRGRATRSRASSRITSSA